MTPPRTLALFLLAAPALGLAQTFALHDGDRVVFYGDSITDNAPYTAYVEAYVVTRFPKMKVTFVNSGVGGDRVSGGYMGRIDDRLNRDMMGRKPTVVTIMLGMNDASYKPFDQNIFNTYQTGYQHIIDRAKKEIPNARLWLIRPSPYDDVTLDPGFPGGYNAVLKQYGDYVATLASRSNYNVIDLNTPLVTMLENAKAKDPANARKIIGDRVHPGGSGHIVMAANVIKSWSGPSIVSSVMIDAKAKTDQTQNATVKFSNGPTLSWTTLENSLPLPILDRNDAVMKLVLDTSNVDQMINQEMLTVKNLDTGNYDLKIDGKVVANFTADQLAQGVNLAPLDTPMSRQAFAVLDLTVKRSTLRYNKWHQLEFDLRGQQSKELDAAIKAIDKLEDQLTVDQHKAAQPTTHQFELVVH